MIKECGSKKILLLLLFAGSLYQIVINWNALISFDNSNDCYLSHEQQQQQQQQQQH